MILAFALLSILLVFTGAWYWHLVRLSRLGAIGPKWSALIPDSCFIEVDGLRVHYVQSGQGPELVLLHGIGASIYIWRFLIPLLSSHFRVTALDLPGFGKSQKDSGRDLGLDAQSEITHRVLTKLEIQRATLVGSSMGGAIALWMAKIYPEIYPRLVVLAPATDRRWELVFTDWLRGLTPAFGWLVNRSAMRVILSFVIKSREVVTDEVVSHYLEPYKDRGAILSFWSALRLLRDPRLPRELRTLKAEVLILYGADDLIVPLKSMKRLARLIESSQLKLRPGGHHIMEDDPVWLAEEIVGFARRSKP